MAAPAPSASRVFVSHSHQDNAYCREFVAGLHARGYAAWYDEHNLGWGALRPTIEKELPRCTHFIAILSPEAAASEWVNSEIDAALDLLGKHLLHTFTFVVAASCEVALLLRRWKRIEGPNGAAVSVAEAVARAAAILAAPADDAQVPTAGPMSQSPVPPPQPKQPERLGPAPAPNGATPAHHLTPMSLYSLGFRGWNVNGAEFILPPICPVPGGVFTMGSDKAQDEEAEDDETPSYPVLAGDFSIGQHPVTVAEYACAVRANAERVPPDGFIVKTTWDQQLQRLDHPVVCVCWWNASAYVDWLAKLTKQPWRLPTEAEWEKMARWDARASIPRRYPWGDIFDETKCNTHESGIGVTTPVGRYPG